MIKTYSFIALFLLATIAFGQLTDTGNNVGIGTASPEAKLHVKNGKNSYGTILANANESSFSLYTKTLDTKVYSESFRIGLKHLSNENNGFISFYRGGSTTGGFLGFSSNGIERMRIVANGNIGIGTTTPDEKLAVNGNIHSKEVKVDLVDWPDFVFNENYFLPSLEEVEKHIADHGHLKDIPNAQEVQKNGILLGEMDFKLLQKIEELTLYILGQEKRIDKLEKIIESFDKK